MDGAVDGGAADAEELSEVGAGVGAVAPQRDQVLLLVGGEFGLLAAQSPLTSSDGHALTGAAWPTLADANIWKRRRRRLFSTPAIARGT